MTQLRMMTIYAAMIVLFGFTTASARENRDAAIDKEALRAAGPAGLEQLLQAHQSELERFHAGTLSKDDPQWQRLSEMIDYVAQQRDAHMSRLYWYTDFEKAKAAAKESGKPILSLRLLGRLDNDLSCANSRFFRTVLYANEEVSKVLREHFVLHWQSVRPVPVITIDMGDGRVLRRTITGNSIHYVLSPDGQLIDGIPGLYGPQAFVRLISEAQDIERRTRNLNAADRRVQLQQWHASRTNEIGKAWETDLRAIGGLPAVAPQPIVLKSPTAAEAGGLAIGKGVVEAPLVRGWSGDAGALAAATDDTTWEKLAALHQPDARLDISSRALMAQKFPTAMVAADRTRSKRVVEDPLMRIVRNFERSLAIDTVRNEYTFHRTIHEWLAATPAEIDSLNEKVYAELFLTPSSNPWLGLVPADSYAALDEEGMIEAAKSN